MSSNGKEKEYNKQIEVARAKIISNLATLKDKLQNKELRNYKILLEYQRYLLDKKPEISSIVNVLVDDVKPTGSVISNYEERLDATQQDLPSDIDKLQNILEETQKLESATDFNIYNDSLIDVVNTLAEMSDGTLPKIGQDNNNATTQVGSSLVGNPQYGSWQTSSSGTSFWAWYGMYSMFSNIFSPSPFLYHNWYYNRPFSYYNDYGRNMYASKKDITRHSKVKSRNELFTRKYGKQTGRNYSAYQNKTSNSVSRTSNRVRNKSSYSINNRSSSKNIRNRSSYHSSYRNRSRTRFFRGK